MTTGTPCRLLLPGRWRLGFAQGRWPCAWPALVGGGPIAPKPGWAALLLVFLCVLLLAAPAHAKRVALLIGNGDYQHEIKLLNPVRDIELIEPQLVRLGFGVEKVQNLDKRGMELAINRFVSKSSGADTALVFYAGHGTQPSKGGRSFLLPVTAKVEDDETLEADGVPAEDIASKLERVSNPAKLRLVILDACRTRKKTRGTDRGLAPPGRTDSYTLIAYSTEDGSTADDGNGRNSPYAQALAANLPRLGKEPVRRMFEAVARDVRSDAKSQQRPRTYGDLESNVGLDGVELASVVPEPQAPRVPEPARPSAAQRGATGAASLGGRARRGHCGGLAGVCG